MAKKTDARAGKGAGKAKKKKKTQKKNCKFLTRVPQYKMRSKMHLRGYATPGGSMMYNDGESATKHFTTEKILADDDGKNDRDQCIFESELLQRPATGVSMACGTIASGCDARNHLPNLLEVAKTEQLDGSQISRVSTTADAEKAYEKTGIPSAQKTWASQKGLQLKHAIHYLNLSNMKKRTHGEVKKQMRILLGWYGNKEDAAQRMREYAKEADFSSRMYGSCIHQMELTARFTNIKKWAKKIPELKKQSKYIQKWVNNPGDEKLFVDALTEDFMSRAGKGNDLRKIAQRGLPGSDEDDDDGDKGEDGDEDEDDDDGDDTDAAASVSNNDSEDDSELAGDDDDEDSVNSSVSRKPTKQRKKAESATRNMEKKNKKKEKDLQDDDKKKKLLDDLVEESAEEENVEAVYTTWSMSCAQLAQSEIDAFVNNYATKDCTISRLKELVRSIPPQILELGDMGDLPDKLASMQRLPKKESMTRVLQELNKLVGGVVAFFEGQCKGNAAASETPTGHAS